MYFLLSLAKVIQTIDDATFNKYRESLSDFSSDYPQLGEKWKESLKKRKIDTKNSEKSWHQILREIRYFKDQELDYMYQRVMALSRHYVKDDEYFDVKTHSGMATIPDRTTLLNRLVKLSDKLLSEIYPAILRLVSYRIEDVEIHSQTIRGNVDWNRTIQYGLKTTGGTPTTFISTIPKKSFSSHENLLLYLAINWLKSDAMHLLNFQKIDNMDPADKKKIWTIANNSQIVLDTPLFHEIKNGSDDLELFSKSRKKIKPILDLVEREIKRSQHHQNVYLSLIEWIRNYINFNTNRYQSLANFTFENVKDFDTMFELWILFEYVTFLKKHYHFSCSVFLKNSRLGGFQVEGRGQKFYIYYEKRYQVPIGNNPGLNNSDNFRKPDFTIEYGNRCICGHLKTKHHKHGDINKECDEIIGNNTVCSCNKFCRPTPIVLDAKNWRNKKRLEAVQKMSWYLVLMNKYKAKTGILFFSNYENDQDENEPITNEWSPICVNQGEWEFVNFVVKASREPKFKEQLDMVFKNITERIPQIKKMTYNTK